MRAHVYTHASELGTCRTHDIVGDK